MILKGFIRPLFILDLASSSFSIYEDFQPTIKFSTSLTLLNFQIVIIIHLQVVGLLVGRNRVGPVGSEVWVVG